MIRNWLAGKDQLNLISDDAFEFCFVVDFPMYENDEETGETIFTHNPFSMPQGGMEALLTKDPTEVLAYQYDLVCNGIELASGAVRNHDNEIMKKAFEIAGYDEEELKKRFNALYTAFQYGAPPHAGMVPGIDRMVMLKTCCLVLQVKLQINSLKMFIFLATVVLLHNVRLASKAHQRKQLANAQHSQMHNSLISCHLQRMKKQLCRAFLML